MPKNKFGNVFNKLNRYLFGGDEDEQKPINEPQETRLKQGLQTNRTESQAKVIHKYPKNGNFRFPLDVEARHERQKHSKQNNNSVPKQPAPQTRATTTARSKANERVWGNEPATRTNPKRHTRPSPPARSQPSAPLQEPEKPKKEYFNNPHFSVQNIPSPVYGFTRSKQKSEEPQTETHAEMKGYTETGDQKTDSQGLFQRAETISDSAEAKEKLSEKPTMQLLDDQWEDARHQFTSQQSEENKEHEEEKDEAEFLWATAEENVEIEPLEEKPTIETKDAQVGDSGLTTTAERPLNNEQKQEKRTRSNTRNEAGTDDNQASLVDEDKEENEERKRRKSQGIPYKQARAKSSRSSSSLADRREKRRQKREPGPSSVPFNVLMTAEDQKAVANQPAYLRKKEERNHEKIVSNDPKPIENKTREVDVAEQQSPEMLSVRQIEDELISTNIKPSIDLLTPPVDRLVDGEAAENLKQQREQLEATLHHFQVDAKVTDVTEGPSVIRFEVQPAPGVKVTKVKNLTDDLKLAMAAVDLRMEAPIPGKNAIGIEVPKQHRAPVVLREILETEAFTEHNSPLAVALGLDITGEPAVIDLNSMPHGLIAGSTGSGKSVCINSILISLLYKASPEEVKLLLIDPKVVELAFYEDVPHLAAPVVTDPKEATMTLKWSVAEMERRYQLFAEAGVRDIKAYNKKINEEEKIPYLVIVIDELADLMMVSPQDVEECICRIAQKARACGIHLLVATQRPSVDVITGLIKANIPTRAAFAVSSMADSRTILDAGGAERLIGRGDMLLSENGSSRFVRLQGTYVDDEEIEKVTAFWKAQKKPNYLFTKEEIVKQQPSREASDELLEEVSYFVVKQGSASTSMIQRRYHIGYNRAARLMDMLEERGIVSEAVGTKPRYILVSMESLEEIYG